MALGRVSSSFVVSRRTVAMPLVLLLTGFLTMSWVQRSHPAAASTDEKANAVQMGPT